ncbi:hypothetical protein PTTG_04202 [Puccinia triticina 1-1 BBBD Race 1]|uniref:Uncharacterized protein n=1 Tax=Puccinia triticina (isolate 1-1 / race 1 (BBBD)) TaxID=630390 RepID=A0A180GGN0_PUCT1|nr:hypothetical protein PTTG_04202 [Puccinia triticina 1-1 BBBD Race 1]
MELFDNIQCCSETEAFPDKTLKRISLPWRSEDFNTLARQLDVIHIHKTHNTKGQHFIDSFNLEKKRALPTSSTSTAPFCSVPRRLPRNCYAVEYLATLSDVNIKVLDPKPEIDFPKLLSLTKGCLSVDMNLAGLAKAIKTIHSLSLHCRIPIWFLKDQNYHQIM